MNLNGKNLNGKLKDGKHPIYGSNFLSELKGTNNTIFLYDYPLI